MCRERCTVELKISLQADYLHLDMLLLLAMFHSQAQHMVHISTLHVLFTALCTCYSRHAYSQLPGCVWCSAMNFKFVEFIVADKGRGLQANKPLVLGELIGEEEPFAFAVGQKWRNSVCHQCLKMYSHIATPSNSV